MGAQRFVMMGTMRKERKKREEIICVCDNCVLAFSGIKALVFAPRINLRVVIIIARGNWRDDIKGAPSSPYQNYRAELGGCNYRLSGENCPKNMLRRSVGRTGPQLTFFFTLLRASSMGYKTLLSYTHTYKHKNTRYCRFLHPVSLLLDRLDKQYNHNYYKI